MSKGSNMVSRHSGRKVANQFVVLEKDAKLFQSHDLIVSRITKGQVFLSPGWDRLAVTRKYLAQFLGEDTEQTRAKVDNGTYRVEPLTV